MPRFSNRVTIDTYDPRYDQPYPENLTNKFENRVTIWHPANQLTASQNRVTMPNSCHDFSVLSDHKFEAKSQHISHDIILIYY
ncbi:hypothetical protein MtrunA17_Chr4g0060691 [Medicago truncatula]|uniref:Uncharacterized protein n=1 Tax=Medicago truncatula TaxID=3880 RepID=A0A396IDN2_MEDTR|nr:hypothetical protein MtrunA17_Chr4g0060691 [Medicago truncatula]